MASNVNLYRFTHFLDFPSGAIFANLLVGEASPIPFEHHLSMMATRFSIVWTNIVVEKMQGLMYNLFH